MTEQGKLKKNSLKKWLIWCGSILAALLIIGFVVMDYAVDYVLDSMVDQAMESTMNIGNSGQSDAVDDGLNVDGGDLESTHPNEDAPTPVPTGSGNVSSTTDSDSGSVSGSGSDSNSGSNTDTNSVSDSSSDIDSDSDSDTDSNSNYKSNPDSKTTYSAEIPTDKAEIVKDTITLKEKTKIASVLLKKFNASEIRMFTELASGGLSIEEKKAAKLKFLEKLSEKEYDQLIAIAAKYGLSQGKTYSETDKPKG